MFQPQIWKTFFPLHPMAKYFMPVIWSKVNGLHYIVPSKHHQTNGGCCHERRYAAHPTESSFGWSIFPKDTMIRLGGEREFNHQPFDHWTIHFCQPVISRSSSILSLSGQAFDVLLSKIYNPDEQQLRVSWLVTKSKVFTNKIKNIISHHSPLVILQYLQYNDIRLQC